MAQGIDATKTPARPSHEAVESHTGDATDAGISEQEKVDRAAMQGAKRAQNRIHTEEQRNPEDTLFTK